MHALCALSRQDGWYQEHQAKNEFGCTKSRAQVHWQNPHLWHLGQATGVHQWFGTQDTHPMPSCPQQAPLVTSPVTESQKIHWCVFRGHISAGMRCPCCPDPWRSHSQGLAHLVFSWTLGAACQADKGLQHEDAMRMCRWERVLASSTWKAKEKSPAVYLCLNLHLLKMPN